MNARIRCTALALLAAACDRDRAACIAVPCAQPLAVEVTVTNSASGAPVPGAVVTVAGRVSAQIPCSSGSATVCAVHGGSGTYELDITAPGFVTAHRQVAVTGSQVGCSCETVATQHLALALVAAG
jgi:hypothetical protein